MNRAVIRRPDGSHAVTLDDEGDQVIVGTPSAREVFEGGGLALLGPAEARGLVDWLSRWLASVPGTAR